jgi:hypothetical protein
MPELHSCLCWKKPVILLIRVKNTDDVMGREDSFSDIRGDRQIEGGSKFLGSRYCQRVNISGRTAHRLTLGWNERFQLFCGPKRGWPQEAAVCWTSSGLVTRFSYFSQHPFFPRTILRFIWWTRETIGPAFKISAAFVYWILWISSASQLTAVNSNAFSWVQTCIY